MCVVALAWRSHPDWHFVAIGNRDELHARPALPVAKWDDAPHVIAGRDVQAGGTWLGVSSSRGQPGRFAVVTNIAGFGMPDPDKASRGELISDYLQYAHTVAQPTSQSFDSFNPFSLITIEGRKAHVHANRPEPFDRDLAPGLHGLSNGPVNNAWPKTGLLKRQLGQWMDQGSHDPNLLLALLRDEEPPAEAGDFTDMPDLPRDPRTVPIFIRNDVYGTRCSTVVLVDADGNGQILERRFDASGNPSGEQSLSFSWQD